MRREIDRGIKWGKAVPKRLWSIVVIVPQHLQGRDHRRHLVIREIGGESQEREEFRFFLRKRLHDRGLFLPGSLRKDHHSVEPIHILCERIIAQVLSNSGRNQTLCANRRCWREVGVAWNQDIDDR